MAPDRQPASPAFVERWPPQHDVQRDTMALISLSDWLDRFGDACEPPASADGLESLRFTASETPSTPTDGRVQSRRQARWRERLRRACHRAIWRLKRLPSGHA